MAEHTLTFEAPQNGAYPLTFDGNPVGAFTPPGDAPTRAALLALLPSEIRQALDGLLQELGFALTRALFVDNPELAARNDALPAGDALILAFTPEAQALAEIPWEYAYDPPPTLRPGSGQACPTRAVNS